ncbi:hypothetical protein [Piscibacillus salipiscarius]|uniref:hypothetical protein n=1 Tax=Piscibacillus salipiscarius TaxID=299480 RepID=UPI0006D0FA20|nr:hypothetical protein [Piscibacillus salipiscarius]
MIDIGIREVPKKTYLFLIINFCIILGGGWLFAELADGVAEQEKFILDQKVRLFVSSIQSPTLDQAFLHY